MRMNLKNSSYRRLTISVFAIFVSASSFGQSYMQCRTIDFAELQSFNREELAKTHCANTAASTEASRQRSSTREYQTKLTGIALDYAKTKAFRESDKAVAEAKALESEITRLQQSVDTCSAENERVLRILTSKNTKIESCNPLTLANITEPPPPVVPQNPLVGEYCQAKNDIQKLLNLGSPFAKETKQLNLVMEKMKKNKIQIPASCPN